MNKYYLLTLLPLLASCSSTSSSSTASAPAAMPMTGGKYSAPVETVVMEEEAPRKWWAFNKRPSKPASKYSTRYTNKGLSYPYQVVDQSADSSLDVTEDSSDYVTAVGTRQTRNYSNTIFRTARRGGNIVRKEGNRVAETVYDVGDQGTQYAHDELYDTTDLGLNGVQRGMHMGGTVVCGAMKTYSNVWDRTTQGIFGGLLRCTVRDTKPYMVGSLNDQYTDGNFPGSGWRRPMPSMAAVSAPVAETSGKGVYTSAK